MSLATTIYANPDEDRDPCIPFMLAGQYWQSRGCVVWISRAPTSSRFNTLFPRVELDSWDWWLRHSNTIPRRPILIEHGFWLAGILRHGFVPVFCFRFLSLCFALTHPSSPSSFSSSAAFSFIFAFPHLPYASSSLPHLHIRNDMSANKYGLTERQAVILTVGFYMLTALVMVSVNKVRPEANTPRQREETLGLRAVRLSFYLPYGDSSLRKEN